ncbi:MAG: alpha-L-rhamnosidase N-terminal domain-containing protein, partial [Acutalibacteraceae bacterium]|nr:alpha-L-rhamnosidase N-terminal domain-containing protein [Acutalibacteraceae bacterium]
MTSQQLFKNSKWIECTGSDAPVFKKTFNAVKGEKAEIIICGLGYFKLFINGKKVSDDLLVPNATNYNKRDTGALVFPLYNDMTSRTYCMKYDITDYLADGENTLAVMLG